MGLWEGTRSSAGITADPSPRLSAPQPAPAGRQHFGVPMRGDGLRDGLCIPSAATNPSLVATGGGGNGEGTHAAVPWGRCGVTSSLSWPYLRVLRRIRTPTLQTILVLTPCSQRLARTSRFWHCGSCCALMARHLRAMQLMLTFARRCWSEG